MLEGDLSALVPVDLRGHWLDEAKNFTPWLAQEASLELLSTTLGMELELEGMEVPVGPYKADIVARDLSSSDARVVIENQLEKTDHDHLGKTITYASGLDARVIIWIAKEFSEEHRRALDFLNENAAPDLRCFGIEIQLWKIDESRPAPLFKVVSSPNDYTSIIRTEREELTDAKRLYLNFWGRFKEYCASEGTKLNLRKPRPQHWFSIAIGKSKFGLNLTASIQKQRIGCEVYIRGVNAEEAFHLLRKQKQAIESETGQLEWMELPEGQDCRIVRYHSGVNLQDQSGWEEAHKWLKQEAEAFHKAFSHRIKALPVLGSTAEENGAGGFPEQDEVDTDD